MTIATISTVPANKLKVGDRVQLEGWQRAAKIVSTGTGTNAKGKPFVTISVKRSAHTTILEFAPRTPVLVRIS